MGRDSRCGLCRGCADAKAVATVVRYMSSGEGRLDSPDKLISGEEGATLVNEEGAFPRGPDHQGIKQRRDRAEGGVGLA